MSIGPGVLPLAVVVVVLVPVAVVVLVPVGVVVSVVVSVVDVVVDVVVVVGVDVTDNLVANCSACIFHCCCKLIVCISHLFVISIHLIRHHE